MGRWVKTFDGPDKGAGMKFFWSMPKWVRDRYFASHPGKRVEFEAKLKYGALLADYFTADDGMRPRFLSAHPDFARWLLTNMKSSKTILILAAYAAIPKTDQWLRRVMREKYPEVFSQEAKGEQRLRRVYEKLGRHPAMLPAFEEWEKAILAAYEEMLRKSGARPRQVTLDHAGERRRRSLSAAEVAARR
jgi:hypothetical protein